MKRDATLPYTKHQFWVLSNCMQIFRCKRCNQLHNDMQVNLDISKFFYLIPFNEYVKINIIFFKYRLWLNGTSSMIWRFYSFRGANLSQLLLRKCIVACYKQLGIDIGSKKNILGISTKPNAISINKHLILW